jgi:hypothetical protein
MVDSFGLRIVVAERFVAPTNSSYLVFPTVNIPAPHQTRPPAQASAPGLPVYSKMVMKPSFVKHDLFIRNATMHTVR